MTANAKTRLVPISVASLPGWRADDHELALAVFRRSCEEILDQGNGFDRPVLYGGTRSQWAETCKAGLNAKEPRLFFEANFTAFEVHDQDRPEGLFTGYFEPEAEGSLTRSEVYPVPIYRKPTDLVAFTPEQERIAGVKYGRVVDGLPTPYFTRRDIEGGALAGQGYEIVWLKSWADAYFIHVQGSGRVRLLDGTALRLSYAMKSGHPYTSIGAVLVERGVTTKEEISMQVILHWMESHPESARALMWQNESFIFFQEQPITDPVLGPPGAQLVPLTPRRSLAVDRSLWMFGMPVWLDAVVPDSSGTTTQHFRHLLIAQDTGSAIKGHARGDVFWGSGDAAAMIAGHMKSAGRMVVLLPNDVARSLAELP